MIGVEKFNLTGAHQTTEREIHILVHVEVECHLARCADEVKWIEYCISSLPVRL